MRRLNRKKTLNLMKELDAFPKVPESYVETSASGGTVSLIAFTTIAFLTIMEFMVYRDTWMKYEYEVDKDFTSKLRINIDITVAMRCQYVGADVLDLAETMVASADGLIYEPVVFDLSPQQKEWQRMLQLIQSRLQEEHSLQDVIFKSAFKSASTALPPREDNSLQSPDACRIHGHLYVNKVAGNFHITVGKAIPHPRGHAHLAALVSHESYNFSHRIDHLSFGELIPGIINPLDGTEKIASDHNQMFQYFITVVPTKLHTYKISAETHQFSVTERERIINHAAGSHGVSGIFMKYDISSLMVTVTEEHMPFWQFLVRLCGIIGGIFSTTGILHGFGRFVAEVIFCRFRLGSYRSTSASSVSFTYSFAWPADQRRDTACCRRSVLLLTSLQAAPKQCERAEQSTFPFTWASGGLLL
ncbi:endoplasmic reticulum-Golgi intermediate compartment protein 2 isoform 1-T6 [Morphnus guianensis]